MKPEKPKTPRQELEASLTALLLGELPAEKAAALRELMVKDVELARLCERLEQTIGLVRETAVPAEQGQSAPLKLSTKRREQLLQRFKTFAPKEFTKPTSRAIRARELAIAAGIVAFIGMAAWLTFILPESYSSTSRLKVQSAQPSAAIVASYSRSPVGSVTDQKTARLATEQALEMAQNRTVAITASAGGGGSAGTPSQIVLDSSGERHQGVVMYSSAGKPGASEIVLPTATDFYINRKDASASLVSTNYVTGDPQWLGILERGDHSPLAHTSTNQFVGRAGSLLQTNQLDLAGIANLAYAPRVPQFVTNRTGTSTSEFAYYLALNTNGFVPQESFDDSTKSTSRSTGGFGRTGTGSTFAENGRSNGALPQLDEMYRRRYGGVAWSDTTHSKQGNSGLADGSTTQMSRSKLQEALRNSSETKQAGKTPAIDPATGLPLPLPELTQIDGPLSPTEGLPTRTLRLPAQDVQTTTPSTPITGEKLAEIAQQAKDSTGSNIYLGRELAKADVKFETWALDSGGLPHETKKEEQRLKQVGEVRDGATTAGQGFSLMGPKEAPPAPPVGPLQPQRVPVLGDLPVHGSAFKNAEANPELTKAPNEPLPIPSTNSSETFGTVLAGVPVANPSGYLDGNGQWQFTTGIENLGWARAGDTNVTLFAGEPSIQSTDSFYLRPGRGTLAPGTNLTQQRDAALLFEMGKLDEAEALFKQVSKEDPDNRSARYYLNLIKDGRHRRTLTGNELVTRQAMVDSEKEWLNPPFKGSELSSNRSNDREMVTRVIQVDKNTFQQGLESVTGLAVGGFTTSGPSDSGVRVVTRTNDMATLQADVRKFFKTMGLDLNTGDGKSVFYNDRDGTLLVRGTREELDLIESAVSVLNQPAPAVNIAAKFAETSSDKDLAPAASAVPNPYARTNLIWTSSGRSGREVISRKLDKIAVDSLKYEGLPLTEVIQSLNDESKKHDPDKRGINFVLAPEQISGSVTSTVPTGVDPATGLPVAPATGAIDLGSASVRIVPELRDVRLADVLDAIVKTSDRPIKYSIQDYGVVFSRAGTKADWEDPKVEAKPVTPPSIPQPEVQTRDNAFSTFSLNVSDVAFKFAAASLEKGQMPEPAGIRSEEFINAFDYRDPEAPAGVPVAFAWERARYPYAQNRDLLRFSIKTSAQGRQAGRPLNLVLLLDNSGSMERADRVAIIREALKVLASQLQPQDKLSVITFARTAQLRVDGVAGNQAAQVAEDIGGLTPEGGTNIEEAMNLAYQTALRHYLANGINRVVLLTDGAANLGNVEPESLKQKVEANRKQGVALDCFGIGWEGFNDDLLETLSRNGDGRYGFINSPDEAATEFAGQLAGALNVAASDVKVQVEFNPARVTAYRQIGYAKHQLTKEQFRDNTVDAAEIAAQEAGNALYVIEVNPTGQGPLGTVRVRFKIPGTSDYREHEWSVPFNGNAVALEQAGPAMRLAATASAFSEWLATSPYATEVTPDTLLSYLSGVPEVYGADARPKKLEWMIRQAKSLAGK
jgi:Mg-chelatase subunit ChlD